MDWNDVRTFRAVAETLSFTQAAEQLHVARTQVSRRVMRLERRLGKALLIRTTRRVTLTPAGERLLRAAREMTSAWEDAVNDITGDPPVLGQGNRAS